MSPQEERPKVVSLRLSEREFAALEETAQDSGLSVSDVIRTLLRKSLFSAPAKRGAPKTKRSAADGILGARQLAGETLIHDVQRNIAIMRLDGVVTLPPGAEIELVSPNVNARVVGVRLLANEPATVCLDVVVPNE